VSARIVIVDMQISNLASVLHALDRVNAPDLELATRANIETAAAVLLPGVGAFKDGMASLREKGLIESIRAAAAREVPIFGICLGMQLLADRSEEFGVHEGLGLVKGEVKRLAPRDPAFRVPNIGWCDVEATRASTLFPQGQAGCYYHVHSYHFVPADPGAAAATMQFAGEDVVVAIEQGNLYGVQFHPEKSQDDGLGVLSNFFAALRASGRVH
jgi:glutamine amidotransferase